MPFNESPTPPQAWRQFQIAPNGQAEPSLSLLRCVLNDARDERPLQEYFASHTYLLTCLLPPGGDAWCWDRPRFGSESIPDFLLCTRNSTGFEWLMVELESPTNAPLTRSGLPSAKLREAQGPVSDWRIWLRDNIAYSQNQLGFNGLHAESHAVIVIGRRSVLSSMHSKKWRELSSGSNRIMTYDRLLDSIAMGRTVYGGLNE